MKNIFLFCSILFSTFHLPAQSWTTLNVGSSSEVQFMTFPSEDTGYVVMGTGIIRKTTNGALNWSTCNYTGAPRDIEFVSGTAGCAVEFTDINRTTDGGATWMPVLSNPNVEIWDLCFATPQIGFAAASGMAYDSIYIYKTSDAGATWSQWTTIPNVSALLLRLYFTNAMNGLLIAESSTYRTTDGGLTWSLEYTHPTDACSEMHSPDGVHIFQGYYGGSFVTSADGGDNWAPATTTTWPGLGIYFTSATHGYYCGGNGLGTGTIEETNNGGITWTPVHSGNSFWCMDFPSPSVGYVGGTNGVIVKYSGTTSVTEPAHPQLTCYPNPATDQLTLTNVEIGAQISIRNELGQIVLQQRADNSTMHMDVSSLEQGVYTLETTGAIFMSTKFVK